MARRSKAASTSKTRVHAPSGADDESEHEDSGFRDQDASSVNGSDDGSSDMDEEERMYEAAEHEDEIDQQLLLLMKEDDPLIPHPEPALAAQPGTSKEEVHAFNYSKVAESARKVLLQQIGLDQLVARFKGSKARTTPALDPRQVMLDALPQLDKLAKYGKMPLLSNFRSSVTSRVDTIAIAYLSAHTNSKTILVDQGSEEEPYGEDRILGNWAITEAVFHKSIRSGKSVLEARRLAQIELKSKRVAVHSFLTIPCATTSIGDEHKLTGLSDVSYRDCQHILDTNKASGTHPQRHITRSFYKGAILMLGLDLLTWLRCGGRLSLVLSGESSSDMEEICRLLADFGIIKYKKKEFACKSSDGQRAAVNYLIIEDQTTKASAIVILSCHLTVPIYAGSRTLAKRTLDFSIFLFHLLRNDKSCMDDKAMNTAINTIPSFRVNDDDTRQSLPAWVPWAWTMSVEYEGKELEAVDWASLAKEHHEATAFLTMWERSRAKIVKLLGDQARGWNEISTWAKYASHRTSVYFRSLATIKEFAQLKNLLGCKPDDLPSTSQLPHNVQEALTFLKDSPAWKLRYENSPKLQALPPFPRALRILQTMEPKNRARLQEIEEEHMDIFTSWRRNPAITYDQMKRSNPQAYAAFLEYVEYAPHKVASTGKARNEIDQVVGAMHARRFAREKRQGSKYIANRKKHRKGEAYNKNEYIYRRTTVVKANQKRYRRRTKSKALERTEKCIVPDCNIVKRSRDHYGGRMCNACYCQLWRWNEEKQELIPGKPVPKWRRFSLHGLATRVMTAGPQKHSTAYQGNEDDASEPDDQAGDDDDYDMENA